MKKIFMLLALMSVTLPHIGAENKRKPLTAEQKAFIVSRFCSEVKYNFVHYDKLKFDWDSLCMAQLPELVATRNDAEFVNGLEALNACLRDDIHL